jgi:hypothetical protein
MTRRLLLRTLGLLGFGAAAGARAAAQAPPPSVSAEKTVWYFYRVKWGFQSEFETLFWRNHYPVLMEGQKRGRITGVKVYAPTYHGDGRSDWTFATELRFRSAEAFVGPSGDAEIASKLYPDQEKFRKEEQRRFEILDAHWDVPLNELAMPR